MPVKNSTIRPNVPLPLPFRFYPTTEDVKHLKGKNQSPASDTEYEQTWQHKYLQGTHTALDITSHLIKSTQEDTQEDPQRVWSAYRLKRLQRQGVLQVIPPDNCFCKL